MPTIEIISFKREIPIRIERGNYNFAIRQNSKLVSHRKLFQDFLNENSGVILHIGNLELLKEPFFFAGELIDWEYEVGDVSFPMVDLAKPMDEQWSGSSQMLRFKFQQCYKGGIDNLIKKTLKLSPIKKCGFLTDVQLGPKFSSMTQINSIEEFWYIHNSMGLVWNTIYIIQRKTNDS